MVTVQELKQEAAKHNIKGRSTMNKAQLCSALAEVGVNFDDCTKRARQTKTGSPRKRSPVKRKRTSPPKKKSPPKKSPPKRKSPPKKKSPKKKSPPKKTGGKDDEWEKMNDLHKLVLDYQVNRKYWTKAKMRTTSAIEPEFTDIV